MKILILAEPCGDAGRDALVGLLPELKRECGAAAAVVLASFSQLRLKLDEAILAAILTAGADAIVVGNPVLAPKADQVFAAFPGQVLAPANHPRREEAAAEALRLKLAEGELAVLSLVGREGLFTVTGSESQPATDCPFAAFEEARAALAQDCPLLVGISSASVMEKQALGHFCDGRAAVVAGYGSLCASADARRLPGGSVFQTDLGYCGVEGGIHGLDPATVIPLYRTLRPTRFQNLPGPAVLRALLVDLRDGVFRSIERKGTDQDIVPAPPAA